MKNCTLLYGKNKLTKNDEHIVIKGFKEDACCSCLTIPNEINGIPVKGIGSNAFFQADIKTLKLPEGLVYINNNAFDTCDMLQEVLFPSSLRFIGEEAFASCIGLKEVVLPEGIEQISDFAFQYAGIERLVLPNSLVEIGTSAFEDGELISVTFGSGIKIIGECAFANNKSLRDISFPEGLKTIESQAFDSCGLTYVKLPESLNALEFDAFDRCDNLEYLYIGKNLKNDHYVQTLAFLCPKLNTIEVSELNEQFKIINGALYDIYHKELIRVPSDVKEITIPKWVEVISEDCFYGIIPEKVIIRTPSLNNIHNSSIDNAVNIVCIADSEVEEWAKGYASCSNITVLNSASEINSFVNSIANDTQERNNT